MPSPDDADSLLDRLKKREVPFLELLKIEPVAADRGRSVFSMVVEQRHLRTLGILHGGVSAVLLDTALGYAAGTMAPEGHFVVTVQLNVNFIRPAWEGETLTVTGEVRHSGRQTAVSCGEIRTGDNQLVSTGTGTFLFLRHPGEKMERRDDPPAESEG